MNQNIINELFTVCIFPLLAILTGFFVKWLYQKSQSLKTQTNSEILQKYIDLLTQTVTQCVIATNQTYVETLKKQGKFDKDAQREAFHRTYHAVLSILTDEAKMYLIEGIDDLNAYLTSLIEAEVNVLKDSVPKEE